MVAVAPAQLEKIISGQTSTIVKKTKPNIETPFTCYLYCTKQGTALYGDNGRYITDNTKFMSDIMSAAFCQTTGFHKFNGKVIGEFICSKITAFGPSPDNNEKHIDDNKLYGYDWSIFGLKIYDKPKELNEFTVIDKIKLNRCPHRKQIFSNPDYYNGRIIPQGYICTKNAEPDFCKLGCHDVLKQLNHLPNPWCYVTEQ